jgi:hypothetical protein
MPKCATRGVSEERTAVLHAVRAGEFVPGATKVVACGGIGACEIEKMGIANDKPVLNQHASPYLQRKISP